MQEYFKDIAGYEGLYKVSNLGNIKSFRLNKEGTILKPYKNQKGYCMLRLCNKEGWKLKLVHRLVAEAFIPNPLNLKEINHKDENKENNTIDNLEWCDRKYNCNYGTIRQKTREKIIKKVYQYDTHGKLIKIYNCCQECELNGYKPHSIYRCCRKENGGLYKNYIWSYKELDNINIQDYIGKTNPKEILQYDKNNNLIRLWPSATSAASENYNPSSIIKCCKGKVNNHKGYIWKYKN